MKLNADRAATFRQLEASMVTYSQLIGVPVVPCGEQLVAIERSRGLSARQLSPAMLEVTGEDVYVREQVAERLLRAAFELGQRSASSTLELEVVCGYRAFSLQNTRFETVKAELEAAHEGVELLEAVHRRIAVPVVAGHPTGGAVDIHILNSGEPIEMGTPILSPSKDSYTRSPFVGQQARRNRQLLGVSMSQAGFAPFDGEWWHHCFGDREWAFYFDKPHAIYEQVEFSVQGR